MKEKILSSIQEGICAVQVLQSPTALTFIEHSAIAIADCFRAGGKLLIAGNGGSLCDAAHFAEEFTGRFRKNRRALPAMAFSEPGHLSCVSNDFGYEQVFSRGVEAFGKPEDVFIGLTTSGNSPNIILAFEKAQELGLQTIAFLGKGGGKLKGIADLELIVDGFSTSDRIQEAHMLAIHTVVEMVESLLFYSKEVFEGTMSQLTAVGR